MVSFSNWMAKQWSYQQAQLSAPLSFEVKRLESVKRVSFIEQFVFMCRLSLRNQEPLFPTDIDSRTCDSKRLWHSSSFHCLRWKGFCNGAHTRGLITFSAGPLQQGHTCYATVPSTQSDFSQKGANLVPSQAIILISPGVCCFYAICNSVQMREWLSFVAGVKLLIGIPLRSFNLSANIHQPQIGAKLNRRLTGEMPRQADPSIAVAADVDEGFWWRWINSRRV